MSEYLEIKDVEGLEGERFEIRNTQQDETIGWIEKWRVGRFPHWCLMPESGTYFTNGCLKEISKFITELYSKEIKRRKTTSKQIRR